MKVKLWLFWGLIGMGMRGWAVPADTLPADGWAVALEEALSRHPQYVALREARIGALKQQSLKTDTASADYFRLNGALYREYKAYICDSALHYLGRNLQWANRRNQSEIADETRIQRAYLLSSAGMYQEASEDLEAIQRRNLAARLLPDYYDTYSHLYAELASYTQDVERRKRYFDLSRPYRDSLMQILSPASPAYLEKKEMMESGAGRLAEALRINEMRLARVQPDTPEYALITYHRSLLYRKLKNREEEKRYLALSALTDVRLAIADHASLWNLAQLLYEEGDIERAYLYIRFSWDETNHYNARSRSLQTAGILSLIDSTYQALREKQNNRLCFYLWLISALSLLLVLAVFFVYHQMKRLRVARNHLQQANEQLQMSNHIKEEYIGRFLKLCSTYIDRLDAYRRMVNKKLSNGQTEELLKLVRSRTVLETDLKDLYANFDTAFLHLFPNFVEKFNALLQPNERILLRKGELLNTELRIFALIRLGIEDSSQIAEFLRYSVNTIYNYRARVKNKACISRDDFELRVMMIR